MKCDTCDAKTDQHKCNCVRIKKQRVAWGICCARYEVGIKLMAEEDFHSELPWAKAEDCTCRK